MQKRLSWIPLQSNRNEESFFLPEDVYRYTIYDNIVTEKY